MTDVQKSSSKRSKYVTVIKCLEIHGFGAFEVVKFSKLYYFDTKSKKKQVQKGVVELSEFCERYLLTEGQ